MAHSHDHSHDDGYFLDQICLVAMSGAFAAVCLSLYFWQRGMLNFMLAPQFHPYILFSGILLTAMTVIRAATLWRLAGENLEQDAPLDEHGAHGDDCPHDHHDHGGHAHADGGHHHEHSGDCDHDHDGHDHENSHDHDHEHGWTPMKCVVLLAPIMFYLLGLPSELPVVADTARLDMKQEASNYSQIVTTGFTPLNQVVLVMGAYADNVPAVRKGATFKELEMAAADEQTREYWREYVKWVDVKGQFVPREQSPRHFSLVRFRMQCCRADAIPLKVRIICKEPVTQHKPGDWVIVTGRVEFRKNLNDNRYSAVLLVPGARWVKATTPDLNPYDQ